MTEQPANIAIPVNASGIDKLPTALRSIIGIGAVSGKNVKNLTSGDSGIDINNETAYRGPNINTTIMPKNPLASFAVGAIAPIATNMPVNNKKLNINAKAPIAILTGLIAILLISKSGKDN